MADKPKANGSLDLASLDFAEADQGALLEVRHPATNEILRWDDGSPYTIKVVGRDSDRFLSLVRKQSDKRIQMTLRTRQPVLSASVEKDDIELLVNATLDMNINYKGEKTKSDEKTYREVYTKLRWLREQVDEFIGNRANFLKG